MFFNVKGVFQPVIMQLRASWLLIAFVLYTTIRLSFLGQGLLADADTYLHVAIGDWIRQHGEVPLTDPFTYTFAGKPWIPHEWLAGLAMSYVYTLGGWYGICVLTIGSLALTLVIMAWFMSRHLPAIYVFLLIFVASDGLESHLLARPHVFVWPLMALWVSLLLIRSESARNPPYWMLPLLVLWANLHGSFVLALAFIPPLAIEAYLNASRVDRSRLVVTWSVFFILALLTCFMTPFGLDGVIFPGKVVSMQSLSTIGEWKPLSVSAYPVSLVWLGLLLVLGLRGLLKLPWIRLLLILGLGWQMMLHGRFYSVFAIFVPLLLAQPFSVSRLNWPLVNQQESNDHRLLGIGAVRSTPLSLVIAVLIVISAVVGLNQPTLEPSERITPKGAVSYLEKVKQTGNGLNFYSYGGYLIWKGIPVFMDGRVDLRGDAAIREYDEAITKEVSVGLAELLNKNQVEWTIFPKKYIGVLHMDREAGWVRAYEDEQTVVHLRKNN